MPRSKSKAKPKSSSLKDLIDKYLAPVVVAVLTAAAIYVFFTRLDKLESITSTLSSTVDKMGVVVAEMDKNYSKDSATIPLDLANLKSDVKVLQVEVDMLKLHR